jgi:predicted metal-dependent peptidase
MPGWARTPAPVLGLVVDTSGSIDGPLLNQFMAEVQSLLALRGVTAYVIAADAAVGQVVEPGQQLPREFPGGGGTDFRPALAHCETRDDIVAVVYFTDGEGQYPAGCARPVLWALTSRRVTPPFGQYIYLSQS